VNGLLAGRRVLVTGGMSGIGAAVVHTCGSMGADGVVLDLAAAIERSESRWPAVAADVTDEQSVEQAVQSTVARLGGLDLMIAAAGVVPSWRRPTELDLEELDRVLAINVRGVAATVKYAAPHLTEGAAITIVGSLNSWRGDPNIAVYAASKHAVLGLIRSYALALGPSGIRVNGVAPGPIATRALLTRMDSRTENTGLSVAEALAQAAAGTALRRIATAQNVADTIAFLSSYLAAGITGQLIAVDGGIL
jgi:3alpha(or 20beta)-hydroxysteroid dehydrogenase